MENFILKFKIGYVLQHHNRTLDDIQRVIVEHQYSVSDVVRSDVSLETFMKRLNEAKCNQNEVLFPMDIVQSTYYPLQSERILILGTDFVAEYRSFARNAGPRTRKRLRFLDLSPVENRFVIGDAFKTPDGEQADPLRIRR